MGLSVVYFVATHFIASVIFTGDDGQGRMAALAGVCFSARIIEGLYGSGTLGTVLRKLP
jgi:hypothetical protein